MSFKLKGNKGRKPSSPGSMSGGTPTNSQSSMGGVSERHESSIDDPLVNAEIKALGISEDNLREVTKQHCGLILFILLILGQPNC